MQTTLDMNIAAMICDNAQMAVSSDGGDRSKAASAFDGEGTSRRFADVLPVAQAALERPSEEEAEVQDRPEDESSDVQVDEDLPADRRQGETESASPEVVAVGWPFAGVLQPESVEVAADGQTAVSSVEAEPISEVGVIPVGGQTQSQAAVGAALANVSLGDDMPTDTVASGELQNASSVEVAGDSVSSSLQLGRETSLPVSTSGEQAPPAGELTQESMPVDSSQIVRSEISDTQSGVADGRSRASVSDTADSEFQADSAVQAEEADVSELPDSTVDSRSTVVPEEAEQVVEESRPATTQMPARSEKNIPHQTLSKEDRFRDVSETTSTENTTAESVQSAGKDISASIAKDATTVQFQQPVSHGGETTVSSQRPLAQSEPQVNADAPVVRPLAQSIGEQILDSVQASAARGDRQVLVRLNPPELGNVLVRFQEHGDLLTGTLEVSNGQTRREIELALPQVARTLQEAGVQVRRLEVVASDQSDMDMSREHLAQDAWSQRQEADQSREQSYASPQTRWSQSRVGAGVIRGTVHDAQSQTAAAQGGIDLLL
jgi:flagellar hook-length control protein FliK